MHNNTHGKVGFIASAGRQDFARSSVADRRAPGFTLVEVAVAMALLLLALTAMVVSFVQSKRSAAISEYRLAAMHNARDRMETICAYPFSSTGLSVTPNPKTFYFSNGFYTVSNNSAARVKDIVVTIKWMNPASKVFSTVALAGSISSNLHQ